MRRAFVLTLFLGWLTASAGAAGLSCALSAPNGSVISNACVSQGQIFTTNPLDWMTSLGPATNPPVVGTWNTSNTGIGITLSSTSMMERAQNTVFAWNGSRWTLPDLVAGQTVNTFQGHFDGPDNPEANPAFGDALIGVLGPGSLTINFSSPVLSAGFQISSRMLADFTATLKAYDSQNNLLGTYSIVANGLGGVCAGLGTLNPNPTPCNDAPFLGFLGSNIPQISRLVVSTNDTSGMFLDSFYIQDIYVVPEPSMVLLFGGGLCVLGVLKRRRVR